MLVQLRYTLAMNSKCCTVLASLRPALPCQLFTVLPDWLQERSLFGGVHMALTARAMRAAAPHDVRALPSRSAKTAFAGLLPDAGQRPEAVADTIPAPVLLKLSRPVPARSLNCAIEVMGEPTQFDQHGRALIDPSVRAGTDYLSHRRGSDGHAYVGGYRPVGVFG